MLLKTRLTSDVLQAEGDELDPGDDGEPIEEQDAVDVLMTWKQTRQTINKEKLARGLGTTQGFKKLEARVKCFKCQRVGHFSRNCPNRKGKASGKGESGATSSKVSYVNMVRDMSGDSFVLVGETHEEEIEAVVESWADKPQDSWEIDGDQVIRHHVIPRSSMFSPVRTRCPVPITELSTARVTVMTTPDGRTEEQYTPNWKNALEAHRETTVEWTGKTIFYKLINHDVDVIAMAYYLAKEEKERQARWLEDADGDECSMEKIPKNDLPVEDHVEAPSIQPSQQDGPFQEPESEEEDENDVNAETVCALVHDAGFGVVDTGCGRGLVGQNTLDRHVEKMSEHGIQIVELPPKMHTFKYGNGSIDRSGRRVELPIFVAGKELRVRLHVVPGDVPLLLSKRLQKGVGAMIDLNTNRLVMTRAGVSIPLLEMKDNSYQINLLDMQPSKEMETEEVTVLAAEAEEEQMENESGICCVFKAERKQLQANLSEVLRSCSEDNPTVVEIFSPGRFMSLAPECGLKARASFDLSDGWDWSNGDHRSRAEQVLQLVDPDLAVMSPPCGPLSKMQNLTPARPLIEK